MKKFIEKYAGLTQGVSFFSLFALSMMHMYLAEPVDELSVFSYIGMPFLAMFVITTAISWVYAYIINRNIDK